MQGMSLVVGSAGGWSRGVSAMSARLRLYDSAGTRWGSLPLRLAEWRIKDIVTFAAFISTRLLRHQSPY